MQSIDTRANKDEITDFGLQKNFTSLGPLDVLGCCVALKQIIQQDKIITKTTFNGPLSRPTGNVHALYDFDFV